MPYLILPILTEGGLFTEMSKLSRNIVGFHETARRDTLASVAKSFTFCNYAKGLELGEFCNRCQQSTQLALSRTEVPQYEVLNMPNLHVVSTYLQVLSNATILTLLGLCGSNASRIPGRTQ